MSNLEDIEHILQEDLDYLDGDEEGDDVREQVLSDILELLKNQKYSEALNKLSAFVYDGPSSFDARTALRLLEAYVENS